MDVTMTTQFNGGRLAREKLNLFLFLSGKAISLFGSAIYTFAIGLYLLKTTGSGLTFATNIVFYTLPLIIFNPFAGVLADKMNKKIVVVGADLLNGLFLLLVYLLAESIGLSLPIVYLSTFIITVLTVFFNIGIEAAKPNLVSGDKLVDINALARVVESSSYVVGPMLGGLIYVVLDIKLFILINALSFLISAFLEYFIDYQYHQPELAKVWSGSCEGLKQKRKKHFWLELKAGYHYIFARQHMKALVFIFIALNFFFNYTIIVPLPFLFNNVWKVDTAIYGIVQGGLPVGMILGALLVKKVMARVSYSKLLKRINFAACIGAMAFAIPMFDQTITPSPIFILIYYTILMLVNGFIVSWVDIPLNIMLQQVVPEALLGRVISAKLSLVKVIVPIALIISGYLLNLTTPFFLFISGTLIFVFFNLCFFTSSLGKEFTKMSQASLSKETY